MARKHTYHSSRHLGRTIYLSGRYAFAWSITVCTRERIVKTTYPNDREVRKEFYKYKRKK